MAKTLSIKNPWAMLIARGYKDIENRSWQTKYRGKILIHASQKPETKVLFTGTCFNPAQWNSLDVAEQYRQQEGKFINAAIIGEVDVVGCIKDSPSVWAVPGEWHWQLKNPVLYKNPILNVKGSLFLWDFDTAAHGLAL